MPISIPFYKIQGCGNDFVVCASADLPKDFLNSAEKIRNLCDRHYGIGSDGLMVVGEYSSEATEVLMFNPDGSPMGMCGNGIRCVVRFLYLTAKVKKEGLKLNFLVSGRKIQCTTSSEGAYVEVDMGVPAFDPRLIPIRSETEFQGQILKLDGFAIEGWAISMGNPHFVSFVEKLDSAVVKDLGAKIEINQFFPERTNVEFVKVISRKKIELVVWERGAGLTLACGSGACAAVVAGVKKGLLDSECTVELPGGQLEVKWDSVKENASVLLKGPALEVFRGTFSLKDT